MANPNLSEIVTTTLRSRTGKLADNVTHNTALLNRLRERGKVKKVSGGSQILQEIEYAENGTFQYYSGYEVLNIAPSDVFTSATFDFKQASVGVTMSGLEEIQNNGPERIIDLLEARISNAEKTMINNISAGVYSDGSGSGGKQIGGLQLLVSTTPTNIVGGINANTWSFWQNIAFSGTTNGGAAVSQANIQAYMNAVWVQLVRNMDKPDIIVADNNFWTYYLSSLQAIQRITEVSTGSAGFQTLKYMSADVMLDGGFGGNAPTNTMYFINSDYLYYRPARDRDMYVPSEDRVPVNQDALVKMLLWAGNMTVSNRRLQGVLYA